MQTPAEPKDRPLKRKYARIERERRFLLTQLPPSVDVHEYKRFHDRYIIGVLMRLRRVERPDGTHMVTKLGQKIPHPDDPTNPFHRLMTTIYLTEAEGQVFASLPARTSTKRRYHIAEQGWTFAIDVYEAPASAAGLLIAEVECDTDDALASINCPSWASREITLEPRWSGALLAEP